MTDWLVESIAIAFAKVGFFLFNLLTGFVLWWIASPKFDHSTKWTVIVFFAWIVAEIEYVGARTIKGPLL